MIYAIRVASTSGSFSKIITSPDRAAARRYAALLIRALRCSSEHRRFIVEPLDSSAQPRPRAGGENFGVIMPMRRCGRAT